MSMQNGPTTAGGSPNCQSQESVKREAKSRVYRAKRGAILQ